MLLNNFNGFCSFLPTQFYSQVFGELVVLVSGTFEEFRVPIRRHRPITPESTVNMTKDPYVVRINGDKQLLYGELTEGKKNSTQANIKI